MRVLLVDDSRTMRNLARRVLTRLGFTDVIEAANGREALERCPALDTRLVLTDWNMPVMDGVTFVRRIRRLGRRMPIIMVTSECTRLRLERAIRAGVNAIVLKPCRADALRHRIEQVLGGAGGACRDENDAASCSSLCS